MNQREAMDELRRMMMNPETTVKQLRELGKKCGREVWWMLRKPEKPIKVNVSSGLVEKGKKTS